MSDIKLYQGDCLEVMKQFSENSIDAICCDPPYGLSFMGKKWDYDVPSLEIWEECLRVLKPGGYLLSFAGTRTQHRMAVRIEDAGFEIRDMIAWIYGSGFPKSLNIGKAVDKLLGNEREVVGIQTNIANKGNNNDGRYNWNTENQIRKESIDITKGTSEWEGWGTALKPALEPITVARKPIEGTVAENCLKWGVGGINIDGCRVAHQSEADRLSATPQGKVIRNNFAPGEGVEGTETNRPDTSLGRFPANLIHDGSDEVVELFPNDSQRFFYCAKASKSERNKGCEGLEECLMPGTEFRPSYLERFEETGDKGSPRARFGKMKNNHPTVKPISLMEYLIKLVSRERHTILDPFMGSGTTGIAAKKLNRHFIGIERDPDYIKIAEARINSVPTKLL